MERELATIVNVMTHMLGTYADSSASIAPTAVLKGDVTVGAGTKICHGAFLQGPISIGKNCLIGNNAMLRGPLKIGDNVRIGFAAELKGAVLRDNCSIGPQCFVADSLLEEKVYLGAQVRTSNHRLDYRTIHSAAAGGLVDTGREKLGAFIGADARLGIQCITLPGRIIAPDSVFGPRITVEKNLPAGTYMLKQVIVNTSCS